MPPDTFFVDDHGYMSTLLHECGHATGHEKRLNRDLSCTFGSADYAKEELRAEIASAFTSQALGFGRNAAALSACLENHTAYIHSWIDVIQDKPNEPFAAIKDAERISDYLLEKGEFLKDLNRELDSSSAVKSLDDKICSATAVASMQVPYRHQSTFSRENGR